MSGGKKPGFRQRFGAWIAGASPQRAQHAVRMYANARGSRSTGGFGSGGSTSADAEIAHSLTQLRARSRQLVRDSAYAKRAQQLVVNNVIGPGVGLQAQVMQTRGALSPAVNDGIEGAWRDWCAAEHCHTGGTLHFCDIERMALGEIFEAGEVLVRKHYRALGGSRVPLALEVIESERLAGEYTQPGPLAAEADVRMGVEVDAYGRPIAYWIRERHPGDIRGAAGASERYERVPADDIFHLRLVDRWPQTRGVPWMHTVLRKFDDVNEYTGSEVEAARASSYIFGTIKTPETAANPLATDEEATGQQLMDIERLALMQLRPGEDVTLHNPSRPNPALEAFLRYMLRELAAGCATSYESLSRDYSQSNYSSSRLALLDDRDTYRALQQWWIRAFRLPLHKVWLRQAVLARAIPQIPVEAYSNDMARYEAVLFKPRGWSWVDPSKEVDAYQKAIDGKLTSISAVIAATGDGRDVEDVINEIVRERELFKAAGIELQPAQPKAAAPAAPSEPETGEDDNPEDDDSAPARVVSLARH